MNYIGDYVEDDVVYLMFNTFSSDDPSASCTITNFINTDVHIHKDDGLTQRNNAAGITVSVDFDGITGSHMIKIDTSDDTVAGFWVTGHDYFVRIEGTTVDGATINAMVGSFSIENRYMRGTDSANTTVPDAAGVAPTAAEIRTEMEGVGTKLTLTLGDTDELQTNQGNWDTATTVALNAQGKLDVNAECDTALSDYGANTTVPDAAGVAPTVGEIRTEMEGVGTKLTLVLEDTADLQGNQTAWATATTVALNAQGKLDVNAECDTALSDYGANTTIPDAAGVAPTAVEIREEIDLNSTRLDADVSSRSTVTTAQVNAEVVDVMRTDVTAEMSQGAPPATPTMEEMMAYLYFRLRNKCTTTADEDAMWDDLGTTKLVKATITDNGTTLTKGEYVSGAP